MVMLIALLLFFVGAYAEARVFFAKKSQPFSKQLVWVSMMLTIASAVVMYMYSWQLALLFSVLTLYRVLNILRIPAKRLPEQHILSSGKQTFLVLYLLQILLFIYYFQTILLGVTIPMSTVVTLLLLLSLVAAVTVFVATFINIRNSKPISVSRLTESELPTVTVAIAARNETPTLVSCLESVLSSNYPKLEIIVLDDDSQDTTAEIIKSFAQDGVRFVDWEKYDGEWLSKNRAYQTLLEHASGELILFMGVDVRLHEESLHAAVEQFISKNVAMMTIVPKRTKSGVVAIFVQPMRYWWELALPVFVRRRPPALSTSWLVYRKSLEAIGGFTSYKKSIIPEDHIAKYFYSVSAYAFTRTTNNMLITTHKSFASQWDTQVRTRYPHAHRRPETVLFQSAALAALVLLPFVLAPASIMFDFSESITVLSWVAVSLYIVSHVVISVITNPVAGFFAPINFPIAIALDIIALHVSMYKYEFSKVIWKGRDVAPKKLQVIPKLPELTDTTQGLENTR
jgi:glycosyltransferase involved in cell wall biosynthesis